MMTWLKRAMVLAALALVVLGLARAAQLRFQQKAEEARAKARAQAQQMGLTRDAAKAKSPTPEITMVKAACIPPGGTGEVVVQGKFAPGAQFIFENDNLEVVKEAQTGNQYRATVKAAAGIGPETAGVMVVAPFTGMSASRDNAVFIGAKFEWTMQAANGWKIVGRPAGEQ